MSPPLRADAEAIHEFEQWIPAEAAAPLNPSTRDCVNAENCVESVKDCGGTTRDCVR